MRSSKSRKNEAGNSNDRSRIPALLCSSLEIPLPVFVTDFFSLIFPCLQATDRDSLFLAKGFLLPGEGTVKAEIK
jgi:hypothetical protein